jgi:hypothetical protein
MITIKEAFDTLKQNMIDDPNFAHGWHCHMAMLFYDYFNKVDDSDDRHVLAGQAAARCMDLVFGVETGEDSETQS